jgi:hypothetical protein
MKKLFIFRFLTIVLTLSLAGAVTAQGPINPPVVNRELQPGESITITKTVTTPEIPSMPDIYFLADTTGSMSASISAVQSNVSTILATISGLDPTAQFGAGDYKDFPYDSYVFQNTAPINSDVTTAIAAWSASGGNDGSEGQFYALYKLATDPAIGWRVGSSRIVVWFGDAPGHDPIPQAATGLGSDIDEADVIAALQTTGIRVIAISLDTGFYAEGLNDNPTYSAEDYANFYDAGYTADGASGQASRIAAATGGVALTDISYEQVVDAILEGLGSIQTDVWPTVEADPELSITFEPVVHYDVNSGDTVSFQEIISVDPGAECDASYNALVTFFSNSYPAEGSTIGTQTITITVPCGEEETGTEGCSLGYWKNHPGCWECYGPDTPFSEVFDMEISVGKGKKAADGPTLMEALNGNGGGVTALARQAVAALLNACDPDIDYPLPEAEIINGVHYLLTEGSAGEISEAAEYLDYFNNLGCPQDAQCEPIDYDGMIDGD